MLEGKRFRVGFAGGAGWLLVLCACADSLAPLFLFGQERTVAIAPQSAKELLTGQQRPEYLINRSKSLRVTAARYKNQNAWSAWRRINPPIGQTCTYSDLRKCLVDKKYEFLEELPCDSLVQEEMQARDGDGRLVTLHHYSLINCDYFASYYVLEEQ